MWYLLFSVPTIHKYHTLVYKSYFENQKPRQPLVFCKQRSLACCTASVSTFRSSPSLNSRRFATFHSALVPLTFHFGIHSTFSPLTQRQANSQEFFYLKIDTGFLFREKSIFLSLPLYFQRWLKAVFPFI